ncbi:DUF3000 family protein [Bifidobacterium sp. CP2]|uniref:DUF3000 family protein n=1 Tax=Bifidobacterium sp. CP2 TaxID=2809025 RepID=UPI001BDBEA45|nr:DUF3000 family protein [Bifidobacterium sp. CP2]MBT1181863.1 DUF3000 family protein [Bifidobacterium sp. CP2]
MADIYAFPIGVEPRTADGVDSRTPLPERPDGVPDDVWNAVESVRVMDRLEDMEYREIPVPQTLADYGIGVSMETRSDRSPHVSGWIMLLHAREPRDDWGSRWRCVAFAAIPLEPKENTSLAPDMYWDDLCRRMGGVRRDSMGGTVTVTQNTTFGSLGVDDSAGCEIRVSFTPVTEPGGMFDAGATVGDWARFIRSTIRFDEDDIVD